MTLRVVGPGDSLATAIAASSPGDQVFFTGDHPAQHITNSGTSGAFCELYSNGTGRIYSTGGTVSGNLEYALWLDTISYWGFRGFTVMDAAKGVVADTVTHCAFKAVEVHTTKDEGWKLRSNSQHLYLSNCVAHDTGIGISFGEGFYVGDASSNWPDTSTPDVCRYIRFTRCRAYRCYGDGWDVKEGSNNIHVLDCAVDHSLGNAPPGTNATGDSAYFSRGDFVYFETCTGLNPPGEGIKCFDVTVGSTTYGRNQFVKGGNITGAGAAGSPPLAADVGAGVASQSDAPTGMKVYSDFTATSCLAGRIHEVGGGWEASYSNLSPGTYSAPSFPASPASTYYTADATPTGSGTTNGWPGFF